MRLPVPTLRGREFDPFEGFRREFDQMMQGFGRQLPFGWGAAGEAPGMAALDVAETKEAVEISTELPGVGEDEVTVAVEGQSVVISGEKTSKNETGDKDWRVVERSYGSFRRVVPLTFTPDPAKMKAAFDKGVLHVSVGKPAEMVEKKVSIPIQKAN
jgi:HSP20 family protein